MSWSKAFRRLLVEIEDRVESAVGMDGPPERAVVVPYAGYGTQSKVWVRGRVIDDPRVDPTTEIASVTRNLRENWRRFATREIAGARLEIRIGASRTEAMTGPEGYFDLEIEPDVDEVGGEWLSYQVTLVEPESEKPSATGRALVPRERADFGVISDIDDTVIETGAANRLKMLRTVLLGNAKVRVPFSGITLLLEDLHRPRGGAMRPLFYVSSGPWNLYDFLQEFFAIHGIPPGPILLQDYGIDEDKLIHAPHDDHKLYEISRIMDTYPELGWVLIGDSGQRDPEIYSAIAANHPDRVVAIVIRDVTNPERDEEVRGILSSIDPHEVPYILVETADQARTFLESLGLIRKDEVV